MMPRALDDFITRHFGERPAFETLDGMSGGHVQRVHGQETSAIVKHSRSPAEFRFYTAYAARLRALGVASPTLMFALPSNDGFWLVMEDISRPFTQIAGVEWQPDPRVLATLARLHRGTSEWPSTDDVAPSWAWSPEMTASAMSLVPTSGDPTFAMRLSRLEREARPLFEPRCWISGDPNPRNWGERLDGSAVLFDWELFGPGSPALDLAIIVPGLGDLETFQRVVDGYAATTTIRDAHPATSPAARDLAVAKATTVVRLLHEHGSGRAQVPDALIGWLTSSFPRWVAELD